MANKLHGFAIKDASSIHLYEKKADGTKTLVSFFDYANDFKLSISAEQIYALAKGVNKIAFDGTPEGSVEFSAEVLTEDLLKTKLGRDMLVESAQIAKREIVTVDANEVTIAGTPFAGVTAYTLHDGSTVEHKAAIEIDGIEGNVIDLTSAGLEDGTRVVVYYLEEKEDAKKLKLGVGGTKKQYEIHASVMGKNTMGETVFMEIILDNASAQLNVELSLEAANPSSVSTTFELLANDKGEFGEIVFL